jgi:putative hemolysin
VEFRHDFVMARRQDGAMQSATFSVPDRRTGAVRVTCRLTSPEDARRAGVFPSERNFDFTGLSLLRERLVEIDALWLDPSMRPDRAFAELGERIARYLIAEGHDFVFTTARIGMADGGHTAASLHAQAVARAQAPDDLRVAPHHALAIERLSTNLETRAAPQLHGWMQLGAWVCGEPGWNRDPHCAEIPLLLPLARLRSRPARRFLAIAA